MKTTHKSYHPIKRLSAFEKLIIILLTSIILLLDIRTAFSGSNTDKIVDMSVMSVDFDSKK